MVAPKRDFAGHSGTTKAKTKLVAPPSAGSGRRAKRRLELRLIDARKVFDRGRHTWSCAFRKFSGFFKTCVGASDEMVLYARASTDDTAGRAGQRAAAEECGAGRFFAFETAS